MGNEAVIVPAQAPTDATYVMASASSTLSAERVLTAGTNTTVNTGTEGQIKIDASGGSITGSDTQVLFFDGANNPAGVSAGPFAVVTSIQVKNGIVVTLTGTA